MTNKEKQESLRASFGPTPDIFRESVKHTLAHIEEEQPVKRFTLRTVALAIVLIILMAGIALAISTSNGIFSFLEKSTPLPTEAKEALQTEFTQEGGDLPHVTFRVRDAISDGKTLFIAVECKTKNPDDVVVTMMDYVPNSDEKVLADWNAMMSNREGRPDLGSITPDRKSVV